MRFRPDFSTISVSNFRVNPVLSSGRPRWWQPLRQLGLAIAFAGTLAGFAGAPDIAYGRDAAPSFGTVSLSELPGEARATEELIRRGGPFPYGKDGMAFGNRERLLPAQRRGFYREYTVRTPGSRDRGARRIVCGGSQPTRPEACYYTGDHYTSFKRIVQ